MASEDEDLIIDLDEEEPVGERKPNGQEPGKPTPVPGPGAAAAPVDPTTGLKDLQQQMDTERANSARITEDNRRLQRERDNAVAFAQEAERRGISTFELYNEGQINAAKERMDALVVQQETAYNDGDFKRVAELNRDISRLGGDLALLERDQAALVQQREALKNQPRRQPGQGPQPVQQQLPADPLERAIIGRTEPTKAFLRKHPELVRSDGTLKRFAIDAHEKALDEGLTVDTQQYFDHIEKQLGGGSREMRQEQPDNRQRLRAPSTAAPVERSASEPSPGQLGANGQFRMTPKMLRLAEEQGVSPKEWATNYVRLLKEGRITPIT